jgi:hypothetical protein
MGHRGRNPVQAQRLHLQRRSSSHIANKAAENWLPRACRQILGRQALIIEFLVVFKIDCFLSICTGEVMRTLKRATRWQAIIPQAVMRVRAQAHQIQLPILPLQSRRTLKTWHPAHLPQVIAVNEATEEGFEIRGVVGVVANEARVEGVATNGASVRSRMWAALHGGMSPICSQLTTQLTKKSKSSRQTEAQR